jgi:hypothetical protein
MHATCAASALSRAFTDVGTAMCRQVEELVLVHAVKMTMKRAARSANGSSTISGRSGRSNGCGLLSCNAL